MKKIYIFNLLLLILPTFLFAQNFAPLGAKWKFEMISSIDTTKEFSNYEIFDTTTFKGHTVQQRRITNSSAPFPCPDELHKNFIYTTPDSIFVYELGKWQLLINFNAKVADTFKVEMNSISPNGKDTAFFSAEYVVDATGKLTLKGQQLRSVYLRELPTSSTHSIKFHNGWFTEKIGHQFSFIPWVNATCAYGSYYDYGLVSYSDSVFGSVVLSNQFRDSMNVLTGIDKNPIYNFKGKIYPNPFKNKISIKSDEKIHQLQLYNINGQLMQQVNVNAKGYDWHPIVQAGIYFVKITDQLGNSSMKKLIKTE